MATACVGSGAQTLIWMDLICSAQTINSWHNPVILLPVLIVAFAFAVPLLARNLLQRTPSRMSISEQKLLYSHLALVSFSELLPGSGLVLLTIWSLPFLIGQQQWSNRYKLNALCSVKLFTFYAYSTHWHYYRNFGWSGNFSLSLSPLLVLTSTNVTVCLLISALTCCKYRVLVVGVSCLQARVHRFLFVCADNLLAPKSVYISSEVCLQCEIAKCFFCYDATCAHL